MDTSILRMLRAHPLARELSADDLDYLAGHARTIGYLRDTFIFHESQPRRFWGMLLKGRVALLAGRAAVRARSILEAGDSFGEGSLLDDYPHSTSALVHGAGGGAGDPARGLRRHRGLSDPDLYRRLLSAAARMIAERLSSAVRWATGRGRVLHLRRGPAREGPAGRARRAGGQLLRHPDPARGRELPHHRHPDRAVPAPDPRTGRREGGGRAANRELGLLNRRPVADAIIRACREIREGNLHNQFVVDVIQGGAGTSTNMNANEVIANRALELLGQPRGAYDVVHPNNHVNLSQSTNDVYPTSLRIAASWGCAT
jgi:aspartate ammonia-lyase